VKKRTMWFAVDLNGRLNGYRRKPRLSLEFRGFLCHDLDFDYVSLGKLPSHAGQCWRQEIAPPPAKKRGSVPPFAERGDEAALRKHEKEPFR